MDFFSYFCDNLYIILNGYYINEISLTLSMNQTIDFLMVCPVSPNAVHISLTICGNDPILSLINGKNNYINIIKKLLIIVEPLTVDTYLHRTPQSD